MSDTFTIVPENLSRKRARIFWTCVMWCFFLSFAVMLVGGFLGVFAVLPPAKLAIWFLFSFPICTASLVTLLVQKRLMGVIRRLFVLLVFVTVRPWHFLLKLVSRKSSHAF